MQSTAQQDGQPPGSNPKSTARPVIQLPSFREVQAAQRPLQAPTLFQASKPPPSPLPTPAATASGNRPAGSPLPAQQQSLPSSTQHNSAPPWSQAPPSHAPAFDASHSQQGHSQPGPASHTLRPTAQYAQLPQESCALQHVQHNPNAVLVSHKQKGNPVLKHIANVRKEFSDIVPDYMIGANSCALFLSLRYHLLKPDYIHFRIRELQRSFTLRVLLCHVDVDDVVEPLQQVTKAAIANNLTLICAWSDLECARYLETFKAYESKPADLIQGRADEDYLSRLNAAVTTVRGVNRTDVLTLGATFHTAAGIMQASMDGLSTCPGIGPTKIRRLYEAFHEPFRKSLNVSGAAPNVAPDAQGQSKAGTGAATGLNPDLMILDSDDELDEPDLA